MKKKLLIRVLILFISFPLFAQQNNSNIPISDNEYQALVDFYKAMGESNWNNKWNIQENNLHEVPWPGVTTENGHVTAINLNGTNNVSGVIPASFGNLKYLKNLSLNGGSYSKDLSTTDLGVFSGLDALESLDLRSCKIKGSIPSSWNKLKKLTALYLSYNAITALPEQIGEMESLVTLDLSYNLLEVLPKELENLSALRTLQLNNNKISDIKGFLKSSINIDLNTQTLTLEKFTYVGTDLKITDLPKSVFYNRAKNDFSAIPQFTIYINENQSGNTLATAQDGTLTIPASYLSTLKTGDKIRLFQQYLSVQSTYYTTINFTTVKVDQPKIPDVEYQALVDFYNMMNGSNWNNKWNTNENNLNYGPWSGISIENGHISALNLNNTSYVSGSIPASFKNLKYLKSLSLYGGYYYKDLSTTDLAVLSELENLEFLDLRYSKVKGAVPSSWNKLKKLNTLYLSNNALTSLPEEMGEMESLVTVDLSGNQIKTLPVSIGSLSKLVTLNLASNQLEVLPKELESLTALKTLNLSGNKIAAIKGLLTSQVDINLNSQSLNLEQFTYEGTDVKITDLPKSVLYNRAKNDFSASPQFLLYINDTPSGSSLKTAQDGTLTIPASYLTTLKSGDKVRLYQQYTIPQNTYDSWINFTTVKVDQPKIPDTEYQALVDFYNVMNGANWNNKWSVSENNLSEGAWYGISIENGHISGINLSNATNVSGSIPASFKNLKYLKSLSLYGGYYYKDLSATDLAVLSELENLEFLDLRYSKVKGAVPSSWNKLKKLSTLYLSNNAITGLPEEMGEMESLVTVDLSGNQIKTLPVSIGSLSKLVTLNLASNQLEVLPKELENLTDLKTLNLVSNKIADIKGFLPSQVDINLFSQNLSIEEFTYEGNDVKITDLPKSVLYNRAKNDFSASPQFLLYINDTPSGSSLKTAQDGTLTIPASYLTTLKSGDKVRLYQQYTSAQSTYDSSINFITVKVDQPKIPDTEYQALVDFYTSMNGGNWNNKWNVSENNLSEGAWYGISIENGHISGINLSNATNVSGSIPASFKNLKYLKSLSLYGGSYAKDLSATDLAVLSELENLEFLDLRYSKVKGAVPSSWNKLKKLNTLYLSNNAITGLPEEMGEMESLVTVDLSGNQIKTLPVSIGSLSKLVTLNLGNNLLEVLPKELENLTDLKTLNLVSNKIADIKGLLPSQVDINLFSQNLSIEQFTYEGNDVKITDLPKSVLYNRAKNDFSASPQFIVYINDIQPGSALTTAQDGTLTIPASYLTTLKSGDKVRLYQQYTSAQSTYDSSINFITVKVDQPKIPDAEYQALVDFYNAMNGPNWNNKWNTTENNLNEGAWYGVSMQNGHVIGLNLNNTSNVSGIIPTSFGNLKYLKNLSLYGGGYNKNLSATDLKVISELESLEYLDMRSCKLKGIIPSSWSKLKNLKTLYLSYNNIEDADEALVSLPILKTVDLTNQNITISTIEIGSNELIINLPTLSTMIFDTNGGSINNTNYFTLYVNGVNKASNYANKEGKLIFKDIALFAIKLTDKIKIVQNDGASQNTTLNYTTVTFGKPLADEEFQILKKFNTSTNGQQWTQKWDISQNNLHEVSWYGVGTKDGHVISLSLAGNNLSGTLPEDLSGLKYLETLNLQSNAIEGSIPSNLGQLTNLKVLYLQDNKLGGKLPVLSQILDLKKLSIANNQFKGVIPAQFNDFQSIEQLDLSNNSFEGLETVFTYNQNDIYLNISNQTIPKDEYLYLKGDKITVELPSISTYNDAKQDYSGKYLFALQANNFKIAEATAEGNTVVFSNITTADIPAGAKITIWQRTGASQGTYIQYKGIADGAETPLVTEEYNALVAFFEQAGGSKWTQPWDTTTNNLHEKSWKGVTTNDGHIVAINLADNNLEGTISPEIGKFTELQTLNLNQNKLTGAIPDQLAKLTKFKTLDLSENKLTDINTAFSANVNLKLDRQQIDFGELPLTLNAVVKDQTINHYDHTNASFSTSQSYNMTLKDNFKMITVPEEGLKLMNLMSEWNIDSNQKLELRQIAGSARNSVLTYNLTYREGDSNLDGIINILDVQSSLNYMMDQKPKYFNYGAADINKDENLNLLDVILLINKIQDGFIEKGASNKVSKSSNDPKTALSIEDGTLYIDAPTDRITAFDIRLKGINKEEIKELLSNRGYTLSIAEKNEETSLVGFSMNETLSGKQAAAKVSPKTTIISAMIANDNAAEVHYKIMDAKAIINDIDPISETTSGVKNYPNSFSEETTITYQLLENANQVILKVYNSQGQMVRVQSDLKTFEGTHELSFLRNGLASGVYLYVLEIQNSKSQKVYKGKMIIQ